MNAKEVDKKITDLVLQDKFSGCIMISKEKEILFERSYGLASKANKTKNNIDTKFNIASVGKTITSIAILQLVQNGKLKLTDTVDKYLPNMLDYDIANHITIQQLLTHTSGLGDYFDSTNTSSYQVSYECFDDFSDIVNNARLLFESGEKWSYSNLGYLVLGFIIQNIANIEYYEYIQKNIFDKADMKNSGFWFYDEPLENSAISYYFDDKYNIWRCFVNKPVTRGTSSGGCFSTVIDLTNFITAINTNILLNKEFTNEAFTSKPELNSPSYGYGFFVSNDRISHGGNGTGTNSNLTYYKNGITSVILCNCSNGADIAANIIDGFIK